MKCIFIIKRIKYSSVILNNKDYKTFQNLSKEDQVSWIEDGELIIDSYSVDDYNIRSADNKNYSVDKEYAVEVVTKDPDSTLIDKIVEMPTARFNRSYLSDGMYHSVFVIIF